MRERIKWELRQLLMGLPKNSFAKYILEDWSQKNGNIGEIIDTIKREILSSPNPQDLIQSTELKSSNPQSSEKEHFIANADGPNICIESVFQCIKDKVDRLIKPFGKLSNIRCLSKKQPNNHHPNNQRSATMKENSSSSIENEAEKTKFITDYRIVALAVCYFRGITGFKGKVVGDVKFGDKDSANKRFLGLRLSSYNQGKSKKEKECRCLNIAKGVAPASVVLIGANGCGKTSLFSALELGCTNDTAMERKLNYSGEESGDEKSDLRKLRNNVFDNEDYQISVLFANKYLSKTSFNSQDRTLIESYDLNYFFCSESDFSLFECSNKKISSFVDQLIGLEQIRKLREALEELQNDESLNIDEKGKKDLEDLIKTLSDKETEITSKFLPKIQIVLESLMREFLKSDFKLSSDGENNRFNGELIINGKDRGTTGGSKLQPRNYLNKFRLKIYFVAVKVSVAFVFMEEFKISFPLVFDDIFDSSDFSNRLEAKGFFSKIRRMYYELKISDKPLQVIFFTQDEVLAKSVYQGLYEDYRDIKSNCEERQNNVEKIDANVILGRLYPVQSVEDKDQVKIVGYENNEGKTKSDKVRFKEDETCLSFYNLYDVLYSHKVVSEN